jgi:hypothetical protein
MSKNSKQVTQQNSTTNSQQSGTSQTDGTSSSSGTTTQKPIAPEDWEAFWRSIQPDAGGLTPDQQAAVANLRGNVGGAANNPGLGMVQAAAGGQDGYGSTYTLAQLQKQFPEMYAKIAPVVASQVAAPGAITIPPVSAGTGADYMGLYANPFESQVVDPALADISRAFDRTRTARASQLQAAGAFGGSASRLGDTLDTEAYLRAIGSTAGGLRSAGFTAALTPAQQDAARALSAGVANQATALDASKTGAMLGLDAAKANQSAGLTAAIQNQDNQTGQQEFDVNAAYKGQDTRNQSAQQYASMIAQAFGIDNATAMNLINAGVTGQNQSLSWLNAGLPLFGQQGSSNMTGNTSSNSSFDSTGTSTTNGTSTTTSSPGLLDIIGGLGGLAMGLGSLGWNPLGGGGGLKMIPFTPFKG